MPLSRLLTLIAGVVVILAMTIWLITSLNWLYSQIAWSASPFLANLLLLLLIILLAVLIGGLVYYLRLLWLPSPSRNRSTRPPVKVPENKSDAASVNLKAVRSQVEQIQDEVARQALRARSQAIESNLSQGNLQVVVFGTGSAGKSSVVNAILGRVVGRVSAPMGTTTVGETYTLNLPGLEREILITDTPGILESGIEGNERGRWLANGPRRRICCCLWWTMTCASRNMNRCRFWRRLVNARLWLLIRRICMGGRSRGDFSPLAGPLTGNCPPQ